MIKMRFLLNIFILLLLLIGCRNNSENLEDLAARMAAMDGVDMTEGDEKRTAELMATIKKYEKDIGDIISDQNNRSEFLKLLGLKYMDYKMWTLASEQFKQAMEITPESSRIHYYRAVALGQMAVNESNRSQRQQLLTEAEFEYQRALELDNMFYSSAAYGLAILYVFEMDRTDEAEELLDEIIQKDPAFLKAKMLRGQLYERERETVKAIEMYQSILNADRDSELMEAAKNRLIQLGGFR